MRRYKVAQEMGKWTVRDTANGCRVVCVAVGESDANCVCRALNAASEGEAFNAVVK